MSDIDLIPSDYAEVQWRRAAVKWFGSATAVVVTLALVATLVLGQAASGAEERVEELQARQAVSTQQRTELEALSAHKAGLEQQLTLLQGLRGGAAADTMFMTIDRALADHAVWFLNWEFLRAGVLVEEERADADPSYFIAISPNRSQDAMADNVVETRMQILGQALDHSAMSDFVDGLFGEPEVVDVRVQRTSLEQIGETSVVNFELAIVLNSEVVN